MSAYLIVDMTIKDKIKLEEYSAAAGPTVNAHGGELLAKGAPVTLTGVELYKVKVIFRFTSLENAKNWYNSAEYQTLIPLREEAMNAVFQLVSE